MKQIELTVTKPLNLCQDFCAKNRIRLQKYDCKREKNMFRKYEDRLCSLSDNGRIIL